MTLNVLSERSTIIETLYCPYSDSYNSEKWLQMKGQQYMPSIKNDIHCHIQITGHVLSMTYLWGHGQPVRRSHVQGR